MKSNKIAQTDALLKISKRKIEIATSKWSLCCKALTKYVKCETKNKFNWTS